MYIYIFINAPVSKDKRGTRDVSDSVLPVLASRFTGDNGTALPPLLGCQAKANMRNK